MASSTGLYQAIVKQCLSGDTVVLRSMHDPKSIRQISLAYVDAPRIGKDREDVRLWLLSLPQAPLSRHLLSSLL